ncbi:sialate O-acetylesterase [bacterium]|nr:sialate O-acetylesterase [bacterium]
MIVLLYCNSGPVWGDVRLPALIDHHMVLQRGANIPIWGWAEPGERVKVSFHGKSSFAVTGSDGRWRVGLEPMNAGGPFEMTISGANTIVLYNILIGDVWVCSGQSNMEWPVKYCTDAEKEITAGTHPKLRLFEVKKTGRGSPQEDLEGHWQECTPHTVGDITGVGYFFCRELTERLDVPIGLIQSAWGGTAIRQWTSLDALESDPEVSSILEPFRLVLDQKPRAMEDYYDGLGGWFEYCFVQMHLKWSYNPIPQPPEEWKNMGGTPSWLYNGMIAPLSWYPIKGWTWYQGESDCGNAFLYRRQLTLLIEDWRKRWGRGDIPFLVVQLANWNKREEKPGDSTAAELREAQSMAMSLPNTGMAVTIDLGEEDVHYRNKQEAGRRLALSALKAAYDYNNVAYSGPVYRSMSSENGEIRLRFDFTAGGLVTKDGAPPKGFSIAGTDRVFVWAEARIEGEEVVVRSDAVPEPVAVRYAWGWNPEVNLYNRDNLPIAPFRTDDWPGITVGKK